MKKIDMAKAIGLADEAFVAEAAPKATRTKSVLWRKFAIVAACISLVVTSVSLWLFLPYNNAEEMHDEGDKKRTPSVLKDYADSEYFDLMYAIYQYEKAYSKEPSNNFEKYIETFLEGAYGYFAPKSNNRFVVNSDDLNSIMPDAEMEFEWSVDEATSTMSPSSSNTMDGSLYSEYVETTDNQVRGVTESDLFKRTKTHIFYLDVSELTLRVYSIAGEASRQVASYKINNYDTDTIKNVYVSEMFLSNDGKTLTLIGYARTRGELFADGTLPYKSLVRLISIDVSNPENIKEKGGFSITGSFTTARVVDSKILLFSYYNMNGAINNGHSDIDRFVPLIDCGEGLAPIAADDIIFPDELTSKHYTVVTKLNESDLSFDGAIACLSYSDTVYVSADKIFVTRRYTDYIKRNEDGKEFVDNANMTEITAISYESEDFQKLGSVSVEGNVKNQYSLDEYEGILRVVTTTAATRYIGDNYLVTNDGIYYGNSDGKPARMKRIPANAALYCIDLSNFEIVGEVRDFAPEGETVESVRFDGTNAYVCTAVVVTFTDPVYFFDLSDLNNITYTDTGDIEGYSSSLIDFGEGLLLGIGYGDNRSTLKIEVYAEDGDKVISLDSYEVESVAFSTDYKSYYIDRERELVGLMFDEWRIGYGCRYVLLGFDGYQLFEVANQKFDVSFQPQYARATIADDYFYMMVSYEFKAIKLFD